MAEQQDNRKGKVNVSIWVDPQLRTALKIHAARTGRTQQDIVISAIKAEIGAIETAISSKAA